MNNILNLFIKNPEKEYHIREVARILKKSPTTISKNLNELSRQKILIKEKISNHYYFKANAENKEYKRLKLEYNLKKIKESGVIEFLEEKLNYPEAIILFGSWRKSENNKESDLDILVITSNKKELNLNKFEKKLNTKIQLFLFAEKDIERLKSKNKELLNNMINGITLYGFWEVFK